MRPPFAYLYDEEVDVLYITSGDNRSDHPSVVAHEVHPGVLLRFDELDGRLVGITLVSATKIRIQ